MKQKKKVLCLVRYLFESGMFIFVLGMEVVDRYLHHFNRIPYKHSIFFTIKWTGLPLPT